MAHERESVNQSQSGEYLPFPFHRLSPVRPSPSVVSIDGPHLPPLDARHRPQVFKAPLSTTGHTTTPMRCKQKQLEWEWTADINININIIKDKVRACEEGKLS